MRRLFPFFVAASVAAIGCNGGSSPSDAGRDSGDMPGDAADDLAARPDAGPDVTGTDAAPDARDAAVVPYAGPDDWCPGSSHCTGAGEHQLYVGVGRQTMSPTLVETQWDDANHNALFDPGESFTDTNGNGRFDAAWIAGFDNARPATDVLHDLEVRAIAFRYGDTTVAWAVVDAVGYFINEMDAVRADPMLAGLDIDRVIVSATHCHECVDTVGMWGPDLSTDGKDPAFMAMVRTRAALAIRDAYDSLRPARMRVAQVVTYDPATGSTLNYVNDTRDPVIYDPTLTLVQFTERDNPANTIGTWVNWAAHPEYSGSENNELTPDYVYTLRTILESGSDVDHVAGLGGTTVFVNGALGGQVGPGGTHPIGADGVPIQNSSLAKAAAAGHNVALMALDALRTNGVDVDDAPVSYRTAPVHAHVANTGYCFLLLAGVLNHPVDTPVHTCGPSAMPWLSSRVTYLQVGPVATITAPGELHPDLWVGYQDPHWSWGQPVLTETVNAPDLTMAPQPPYLRDLMLANPGVRYAFVSGLAEDFLGYIVPRFNFVLSPTSPYLSEADGDHYEETNSIGPEAEEDLQHPMMELARWRAPGSDQ